MDKHNNVNTGSCDGTANLGVAEDSGGVAHLPPNLSKRTSDMAADNVGKGDEFTAKNGAQPARKRQRISQATEIACSLSNQAMNEEHVAKGSETGKDQEHAQMNDLERSVERPSLARIAPRSCGIQVEHVTKARATERGGEEKVIKTYCVHDVSVPADYEGEYDIQGLRNSDLANGKKMAKEYSFELDAFQRESVKCLERGESVLVSAHTSAGKTAIAEYAIAMSMRDKQRVIYTSPIKALSNQKYRELSAEFEDVGLMTGDTTIKKNASCLVMTTEILRSMLYRGSEVTREVAWVIFDEVHYMRDRERGVVWEETIILVPQNVRFVFLSATIPNAREFSEWISQLKNQPCHAIYTDTRPVPLKHYIFPSGGTGLHLVVDEKGQFRADCFEKAMAEMAMTQKEASTGKNEKRRRFQKGSSNTKSDCYKVVKMIMERNFYPVIVFSFSRRECESMALQIIRLDFNTDEEKELVERVFENAMDPLAEEDKTLPQIVKILPLLKNGIGIHHSGLLPIVKEIVEILFQEGLIKALFATETFAMGLNMPAKTVFFTALQKFDGESFRTISGGEYIQMSGRAGRRGLDDQGVAILLCNEKLEPSAARSIMSGTSEPLRSTFKLGYNMLLNLLRAEEADPEFLIARSFAQFQADRTLPQDEERLAALERRLESLIISDPSDPPNPLITPKSIQDYFKLRSALEGLREKIRAKIHVPNVISPFLQPGRLARVYDKENKEDFGWGVVVNFSRNSFGRKVNDPDKYLVDILLSCKKEGKEGDELMKRPKPSEQGVPSEWIVIPCSMSHLNGVSALRVYKPNDLRPFQHRTSVGKSVCEAIRRFPDGLPLLDPLLDLKIKDESFVTLLRQAEAVEEAMSESPVYKSSGLQQMMDAYNKRLELENEAKEVKRKVRLGHGLIFKDKLRRMKRVLRRLGFISEDGVVEVKGRLACEVSTADELVLTEFIMGGALNDMKPEVVVSIMSCFVFDDKSKEEVVVADELGAALAALQAVVKRIAAVKKECRLEDMEVKQYIEEFPPDAMKVVYRWCCGESFQQVCSVNKVMYEGSIVRTLRRLDELMRQLICAAKSIGNEELEKKFEEGITKLRRGIPFQSSLYT